MTADKVAVGKRLRAVREERGWSRVVLAARLRGVAVEELPSVVSVAHMIKEWEAGKHAPSERYRLLYSRAFGIRWPELVGDGIYDRVGVAAVVALPDLNGRPVDAGHVELIRETNQFLVRLDTQHGGNEIFPLALRAFRAVHDKLAAGAYVPGVERDLTAAVGEAGQIAAWLAYDADRQAVSRQLIHEAMMLSRLAGDREMELFEMGHLAMQSIHLRRPAEGLRMGTEVLERTNLPPRVAALFEIRRGRALAQLGDATGAFGALEKARSALMDGIGPRDPYWTWWVTDAEVDCHLGWIHADLGDWAASVEFFQDSADRRGAYRRARYNDLVNLLTALAHVRDWRNAETVLVDLAGQVGEVASMRTTNLLRRSIDRIDRTSTPPTITGITETLKRLLSGDRLGTPDTGPI